MHKAAAYGGPGQTQRKGSGEPSRQATGLRRREPACISQDLVQSRRLACSTRFRVRGEVEEGCGGTPGSELAQPGEGELAC